MVVTTIYNAGAGLIKYRDCYGGGGFVVPGQTKKGCNSIDDITYNGYFILEGCAFMAHLVIVISTYKLVIFDRKCYKALKLEGSKNTQIDDVDGPIRIHNMLSYPILISYGHKKYALEPEQSVPLYRKNLLVNTKEGTLFRANSAVLPLNSHYDGQNLSFY